MKTNKTTESGTDRASFHSVEFFRGVKAQIAKETEGMSFQELKRFIRNATKQKGPKSRKLA